jgi:hypothetical protein
MAVDMVLHSGIEVEGAIVVAMAVDMVLHSGIEVEGAIVVEAVTVWAVEFDLAVVVAVHSAAQCKHKSRTPLGQWTVMNRPLTQALTDPG